MLSFSNASSHVVGDTDGLVLGLALGLNEGDTDGLALGLRLGLNVGDKLGDDDGLEVGLSDGLLLGLNDGDRLGLRLGLAVGATHPRHVTTQLTRTYALVAHCPREYRAWHSDVAK